MLRLCATPPPRQQKTDSVQTILKGDAMKRVTVLALTAALFFTLTLPAQALDEILSKVCYNTRSCVIRPSGPRTCPISTDRVHGRATSDFAFGADDDGNILIQIEAANSTAVDAVRWSNQDGLDGNIYTNYSPFRSVDAITVVYENTAVPAQIKLYWRCD